MAPKLAFWQGKFQSSIAAAIENLEAEVAVAKETGADLVVFPELYLGGYMLKNAPSRAMQSSHLSRLQEIASNMKIGIVLGYFENVDGKLYNSAVAIDASGTVVSNYRKSHLFGEAEKRTFAPGDRLCEPFDIAGIKAAIMICYDLEFCEVARIASLKGANLLIVPTANFTPYDKVNETIVPVRALENHCFVCYCNWCEFKSEEGVRFNGLSSVCGPNGDTLAKFNKTTCGIKIVDLVPPATADAEDDYLLDRRPELYVDLMSK